MRGGRVPDMPGLKYKLIRGKYDFQGVKVERQVVPSMVLSGFRFY